MGITTTTGASFASTLGLTMPASFTLQRSNPKAIAIIKIGYRYNIRRLSKGYILSPDSAKCTIMGNVMSIIQPNAFLLYKLKMPVKNSKGKKTFPRMPYPNKK
jgi:hypothetical protein